MFGLVEAAQTSRVNDDDKITVYQVRTREGVQHMIWNVEDALKLRRKHGLLGDYVGTLPKHLSQNQFLTVPLVLNDDEVVYALKHDYIRVLSDYPNDYPIPSAQTVEQFQKDFEDDVHRQIEEAVIHQREERRKRKPNPSNPSKPTELSDSDLPLDLVKPAQPAKSPSKPLQPPQRTSKKRKRAEMDETEHEIEQANGFEVEHGDAVMADRNRRNDKQETEECQPAQKARRVGLFERISHGIKTAFRSITSFTTAGSLPSNEHDDAMQVETGDTNTNHATDAEKINGIADIIANGDEDNKGDVPNANSEHDAEADEKWREEARQKVLDEKVRRQAVLSALVMSSTCAREDEIDEDSRQELNINHIPIPFGMTASQRTRRQKVFEDLKSKGYVLSCGAKFGADFLAYAADPQLFHAALAVIVVDGSEGLNALDIIAIGRLGNSTRKRSVLAWPENNGVNYVGIQWEETLP